MTVLRGLAVVLAVMVAFILGFVAGVDRRDNYTPLLDDGLRADGASGSEASRQPAPSPSRQSQEQSRIQITNVDTRVTESNHVWSKFAWMVTIANAGEQPEAIKIKVQWLDGDGFVVDEHTEYDCFVPAREYQTFRGFALIDASAAPSVSSINAVVNMR